MPEPITIGAAGVAAGAIGNAYLSDKFGDEDEKRMISLLEDIKRRTRNDDELSLQAIRTTLDAGSLEVADTRITFQPTSPFRVDRITLFYSGAAQAQWNINVGATKYLIMPDEDATPCTLEFPFTIPGGADTFLSLASGTDASATLLIYLIGRYIDENRR